MSQTESYGQSKVQTAPWIGSSMGPVIDVPPSSVCVPPPEVGSVVALPVGAVAPLTLVDEGACTADEGAPVEALDEGAGANIEPDAAG